MSAPNFDPFYSAKLRIARAKEHLDDLETKINNFFAEKPYATVIEPDPDGIHQIHKLRFTERFPFRWRVLATEIVEHLRAALDHATWATAWLKTGDPNIEQTAFPFASTAAQLDNSMRRRSKNLPQEIQAFLRTLNPYEGGNDALYTLNNLCNSSKHALATFVAGVALQAELKSFGDASSVQIPENLFWDTVKNEIEYARAPLGFDFKHQAKLIVFVALQYKDLTSPEAATILLDALHREVDRVVRAIEAKSREIGLLT
jgi:hypothetical protein